MKIIQNLFILIAFSVTVISCQAQTEKGKSSTSSAKSEKVEVYYFHYSQRCVTCKAVESVSQQAVSELDNNQVNFMAYNLDDQDGQEKGKQLNISGQTLLIVSGDTRLNLTNEGFLYARTDPEKLKSMIKEKIKPLLQ